MRFGREQLSIRTVVTSIVWFAAFFAAFALWQTWGAPAIRTIALAAAMGSVFAVQGMIWTGVLAAFGLGHPRDMLVKEVDGEPRADWKGIGIAYVYVVPLSIFLVLDLAVVFGSKAEFMGSFVFTMLLMPLISHTSQASEWRRKKRHGDLDEKRQRLAAEREHILAEARAKLKH